MIEVKKKKKEKDKYENNKNTCNFTSFYFV